MSHASHAHPHSPPLQLFPVSQNTQNTPHSPLSPLDPQRIAQGSFHNPLRSRVLEVPGQIKPEARRPGTPGLRIGQGQNQSQPQRMGSQRELLLQCQEPPVSPQQYQVPNKLGLA